MKTIIITCKNLDCDHQFRIPEYVWGKNIKTSTNQECISCKNRKLLEKSQSKRTRNRKPVVKKLKTPRKKKRKTWVDKPFSKMLIHIQQHFCNPYIRARDHVCFRKCISCGGRITQAGHRYSIGDFPGMRLMINNIHGQEISCNGHKNGNVEAYDRGLIARHGEQYLTNLKNQALLYQQNGSKISRSDLIEIGKTYLHLKDNQIWIFTPDEFDQYRETLFNV